MPLLNRIDYISNSYIFTYLSLFFKGTIQLGLVNVAFE